jgi:hypothetical protein
MLVKQNKKYREAEITIKNGSHRKSKRVGR